MTVELAVKVLVFVLPSIFTLYITFQDRLKRPTFFGVSLGVFIFLGASLFLALLFLTSRPTPFHRTFLSAAAMFLGAIIFYLLTSNYSLAQSILIVAIVKCYSDDVTLLSNLVCFFTDEKLPTSLFGLPLWPALIITVLTLPLICLFFKKLLRPTLDHTESLTFWRFVWAIPLGNNILYNLYINLDLSKKLVAPGIEFYLAAVLWVLLSFSTYTILLKMIMGTIDNANLQERLHISETQIAAQTKLIESSQQRNEESAKARHDMHHHLTTLQGFIAHKDYTGLNNYLTDYASAIPAISTQVYCEHIAFNTLLCHYVERAQKEDIQTHLSALIPAHIPFHDMDISIILGNLLENAIEACSRQTDTRRFLSIKLSMPNASTLVILTENSYEGEIRRCNEHFLSSKEAGRVGMGISSILSVVEKYDGIHRIDYQDHVFRAFFLLNKLPE